MLTSPEVGISMEEIIYILFPLMLNKKGLKEMGHKLEEVAKKLDIADILDKVLTFPSQLVKIWNRDFQLVHLPTGVKENE
jgi:hypothetical protein